MDQIRYESERGKRLPIWVLPVVFGRHSNRFNRRQVIQRLWSSIIISIGCIALLPWFRDMFLIAIAIVVSLAAVYIWLGIRWLDRHDAWNRGPHPMRLRIGN
jgi:hypothetical protein